MRNNTQSIKKSTKAIKPVSIVSLKRQLKLAEAKHDSLYAVVQRVKDSIKAVKNVKDAKALIAEAFATAAV